MKGRTLAGMTGTILWLAVVAALLVWKCGTLDSLDLADWGNFIAGASSGLALLWLVLGYYQQAEELRLNTKALELQAEELKHQVEETRALVRESQSQAQAAAGMLELERQNYQRALKRERELAKPRFVYTGGSHGRAEHKCEFRNVGAPVHNVRIAGRDANGSSVPVFMSPSHYVDSEGPPPQGRGSLIVMAEVVPPLLISITYVDRRGIEDTMSLEVNADWMWTAASYESDADPTGAS